MPLTNSPTQFGVLARSLHWLTALLILTAVPLGVIANRLPYDTAEGLAQKAQLFSVHKTIGIAAFLVAFARILWALTQTRPVPLHPERRLETVLAEAVHWTLYISLLAVPLTGWVHHAAVDGFAPILWPLGQNLPMVPKSQLVGEVAASLHWVLTKLLIASILLHVAGALKHHLIDRDATLRRMWRGTHAPAAPKPARHGLAAPLVAVAIYAAGAGLAWSLVDPAEQAAEPAAQAAIAPITGNWTVNSGDLKFAVVQMGSAVEGSFAKWTADIRFDEATRTGMVLVSIDTNSLTLGSVTKTAKEPGFFDVATHPTAVFEADLSAAPGSTDPSAYVADGTLTLRGVTLPVQLPFTLTIDGATATVTGTMALDRRDYKMGEAYPDEASVGFGVAVSVALTSTRAP